MKGLNACIFLFSFQFSILFAFFSSFSFFFFLQNKGGLPVPVSPLTSELQLSWLFVMMIITLLVRTWGWGASIESRSWTKSGATLKEKWELSVNRRKEPLLEKEQERGCSKKNWEPGLGAEFLALIMGQCSTRAPQACLKLRKFYQALDFDKIFFSDALRV